MSSVSNLAPLDSPFTESKRPCTPVSGSPSPTSEIKETYEFSDLIKECQFGTWIFSDFDNCLAKTTTHYGSDQWFRWRIEEVGIEKALNQWNASQHNEDLEPVEERTTEIMMQFQKEHVPTFGLTSRGMGLASRTVKQLKAIDIDFSGNPLVKGEKCWEPDAMIKEHILLKEGIVFMSGQNKGLGLKKVLEHLSPQKPNRIVFIDDSRKHVEDVAKACHDLGISFCGYHYRRTEDWVSSFDPQKASAHLKAMEAVRLSAKNFGL